MGEKIEVLSRTCRATGNKHSVTLRCSKRISQYHIYSNLTLNRIIHSLLLNPYMKFQISTAD